MERRGAHVEKVRRVTRGKTDQRGLVWGTERTGREGQEAKGRRGKGGE